MKKLLAFLVLLMLGMSFIYAQADGKDLYIDRNVQKIFTSEDGLLSTSTQAVAQTSEGFIWIGGYGGLVRYDGRRFTTFAYKRITRVSDLAAGEGGVLWVATSDKGLFKYTENDFVSIPSDGSDVLDVECLAFAPDGTLYLGTNTGLCRVEDDRIVELDIPILGSERIVRLLCLDDGHMLCITRAGCLFDWDGENVIQAEAGDRVFRSVCLCEQDGTYLAGTAGDEVVAFDAQLNPVEVKAMAGLSCINDLSCDGSGEIWLCADNGIAVYVDGSVRMQHLLMNNSVDRMLVDREGNYWFVSSRQGVLEVSRSMFGDISRSAALDPMVVNAIQKIGDTLYIGHDAGLVTLDAADFKAEAETPFDFLNGVRVRTLLADSSDTLWIGTMKRGVYRVDPDGSVAHYASDEYPELQSDNIRALRACAEGVLVSTDVGAYVIDGEGVRNVSKDPAEIDFRILCSVEWDGQVCLGSDGNGLYLMRDGEVVRHITTDDGLSSNVIMKAYPSDAYGGLWLVTGNDIDYLGADGGITSIANFPSTNNLDLLLLDSGDAWVLTGSGIYLTTERSLLEDEAPKYQQFRNADGLPYEVTPNAYQCFAGDTLYVCGSGGVFSLQTDFRQAEAGAYSLVVDSVQADGQTVYLRPGEPCTLDAGVKRVVIDAYVLTYQTGNPLVFYELEGFDDRQTADRLGSLGDISYTNLNGGSYTFHFGILDDRTGEVLQELTLPIEKLFPWYEKPQVRLAGVAAVLAALAAAVLLIIRKRSRGIQRRLEQEFAQKERQHLERIAYEDYLTGLYNRNYLDVWNGQGHGGDRVSFVSIDLNDLKKVNDTFGHKEGDRLLCAMARLLKTHFDGEQYAVLRTGGDEFLILARGVDEGEVVHKLEAMAEDAAKTDVRGVPLSFSYGVCTQQPGVFDFEAGLKESDLRMLENKNRFHGRVQ